MTYRPTLLALVLLVGCGSGTASTSAELTDALTGATAGETVTIAAGTFVGNFEVPAGVTVRGAGAGTTILRSDAGQVLNVRTSAGSTSTVEGLTVESAGGAGIALGGAGGAALTDVTVSFTRGVGVGAEGLATLALTRVNVQGPVTSANATMQPVDATPETAATHGLVVVNVAEATAIELTVGGAALIGALFVDSDTTWTGGAANENLGVGLMASGGTIALDSMEICRTLQGFRLPPVFGGVFTDSVVVTSNEMTVCENDGFGLVHSDAGGRHTDLVGASNSNAALWAQQTSGLEIDGAGTVFSDNEFAGMVFIDSSDIGVTGASVEGTRLATRTVGLTGRVDVGDGIQLVRSTSAIAIDAVTLTDNERAGLLLDLGAADTSGVGLTSVNASGTGAQLGVIAQSGTIGMGWDSGVTRSADLSTNDAAFQASGVPLDVVGIVTPTDLPATTGLSSGGLSAVGIVTPTD